MLLREAQAFPFITVSYYVFFFLCRPQCKSCAIMICCPWHLFTYCNVLSTQNPNHCDCPWFCLNRTTDEIVKYNIFIIISLYFGKNKLKGILVQLNIILFFVFLFFLSPSESVERVAVQVKSQNSWFLRSFMNMSASCPAVQYVQCAFKHLLSIC